MTEIEKNIKINKIKNAVQNLASTIESLGNVTIPDEDFEDHGWIPSNSKPIFNKNVLVIIKDEIGDIYDDIAFFEDNEWVLREPYKDWKVLYWMYYPSMC